MGKQPEQRFLHRQHMGIYNKDVTSAIIRGNADQIH